MDIADTIDWRRVKSFSMLCTVSEIYKVTKHYSEARDILLLAYERYPDRANVVYALCELAVKLDEVSDAIEYYREYVHLKPHDTNRYVLLYKIYDAQDVPLEEKISLLEEFKRAEYTEKWAYELALLYHKDGQETKCVETCDELALWFGDGPYVRKALELKMQHSPLTKEQQQKYDGVYDESKAPTGETEETVHIYETQSMPKGISAYETSPMGATTGSLLHPTVAKEFGDPMPAQTPSSPAGQQTSDIQVSTYSNDKYSTMNLQEELAKNMEEFYAKEKSVMPTPYYGVTSQLYDQSQEQFMQQLNSAGPIKDVTVPTFGTQISEQEIQQMTDQAMQQAPEQEVPQMPDQAIQQAPEQEMPQIQNMAMQQAPNQDIQQIPGQMMPQMPNQAVLQMANRGMGQMPYALPGYGQIMGMPGQAVQPMMNQGMQQMPYAMPAYGQGVQQMPYAQPGYGQPIQQMPNQGINQAPYAMPAYQTPQEPEPVAPAVSVQPAVQAEPVQKPDQAAGEPADEQIPGQIDLSDFMKDWEEKKKNGEEQHKQQILNRTKEQTQDIMSQLVGVIPGIDDRPAAEEPQAAKTEDKKDTGTLTEEVIKDDKKGVVTRTTIPSPVFDREEVKRTKSGARINGPAKTSITEAIPDILPNADIPIKSDILPNADISIKSDILPSGSRLFVSEEEIKEEPAPAPEPLKPSEDYGETEEIEEIEQADIPEGEEADAVSEPLPEIVSEPLTAAVAETAAAEPEEESVPEALNEETEPEEKTEEPAVRHGLTAPIQYPYSVDDLGEVEELETIDQPYDVDDMLKTRPMPQDEIEARMRYEAGIEEEYSAEEDDGSAKKANHPSWMKLEENVTSRREFDESEMAIFGRFEGIESLKAQIVDVMDDMRMEASRGNVIVMGSEKFGRKSLAIDIVKAIQAMDSTFSGKVAKISGEALNKKNISMTLQKLRNGALIVENAGGLTPITVNAITETLRNDVDSILVVLEGEKDSMEPLLNGCMETRTVFDARITIEDFSNSDLVAYAKGYARELEYSIDDMGTLALYNKIGDMQTIDHVVSVDEVIDIVDNAIRHVDRKNMSHFMDVLLAKRYDDDDFIVLREKDFLS